MADPRGSAGFTGLTGPFMTVKFDQSIPVPGFLISTTSYGSVALGGPSVSNAVGMAVTDVSTSSYNSPSDAVIYGLGRTADPVGGFIVKVEPDGFGTIRVRGMAEALLLNNATAPAINGPCAVDGAGNVIAGTTTDNRYAKCICRGFKNSWVRAKYNHLQGLITPPTTPATGDLVAIVELL